MPTITRLCAAASLSFLAMVTCSSIAQSPQYMGNQDLSDAAHALASTTPHASLTEIGRSLEGLPIYMITLAGDPDTADTRPAMLITAGIDAQHLVGTETAMRVAERLVQNHADLLDEMTLYIIPRLNPDGASRNLASISMGYSGNARATDDDRDRAVDEDAPDDLNDDGYITMMRRLNPPINDPATHLADPDNPSFNLEAKPDEDLFATFTLYQEGIDNDLDGAINEDAPGSVDLNANFMHRWPEHATHAGRYPLSEPESEALARFVLDHQNIVIAMTYGLHDNLINLPDSKSKDLSGRAPKGIDAKDAEMYKAVSKLYKDTTGQKSASKQDAAGSFHEWIYAQRGIPSFASVVWARPEPDSDDGSKGNEPQSPIANDDSEPTLTPSGLGDISQETLDELSAAYEAMTGEKVDESMVSMATPEMIEGFAAQAGIEVRRVKPPEPENPESNEKDAKTEKKKTKSEDAKWLAYFEQSGIHGFVEWEPYDHPTLGAVEIGGFIPLAKTNPPASDLDKTAEKQTEFIVQLLGMRPTVQMLAPEINQLSTGIYEIRFAIENTGKLPTSTAYAQSNRTVHPIVIRISAEVDRIITGQRVSRVYGLDPHHDRSEFYWVIRTDNIDNETIEINDPRMGNHTINLGVSQ